MRGVFQELRAVDLFTSGTEIDSWQSTLPTGSYLPCSGIGLEFYKIAMRDSAALLAGMKI
jgi:hypothetical protein